MKWSLENCHRSGSDFLKPCAHAGSGYKASVVVTNLCQRQIVTVKLRAADFGSGREPQKAYIGVELPHKRGEVVVLEVLWQQLLCTLRLIPHCEAAEHKQNKP